MPFLDCLKCRTGSLQSAAMVVAIIDTICTSILLILFVLGSSLMLAFQIIGKPANATRVLDIVTDDVFGTVEDSYTKIRANKDVAEDMGVWLIVMFLTIVDFIISYVFLDGVRSRNERKVQSWFDIRCIIIVVFKIIVFINIVYGTSWLKSIPDLAFTIYRLFGIAVGYAFLKELREARKNRKSTITIGVPTISLVPPTPTTKPSAMCASFSNASVSSGSGISFVALDEVKSPLHVKKSYGNPAFSHEKESEQSEVKKEEENHSV